MRKEEKNLNYKLAVTGAFSAIVVILGITRLGFISINPAVSLTILQIPVILTVLLAGFVPGLTVGVVFGIFSLIQAAMSPAGGLDPLFVNPLVSIVPRMMIAVVTFFVDFLLRKIPHMPKIVSGGIAAFFGSLSNTVFVIGALYLIFNASTKAVMGGIGYFAALAVLMPNALIEAAVSVLVSVLVLSGIYIASSKKSKVSKLESFDKK